MEKKKITIKYDMCLYDLDAETFKVAKKWCEEKKVMFSLDHDFKDVEIFDLDSSTVEELKTLLNAE